MPGSPTCVRVCSHSCKSRAEVWFWLTAYERAVKALLLWGETLGLNIRKTRPAFASRVVGDGIRSTSGGILHFGRRLEPVTCRSGTIATVVIIAIFLDALPFFFQIIQTLGNIVQATFYALVIVT